jgi:D-alanyl-D-alanine carboxypeptidase/D-alanyl-D-alanine-endopeptidase (penicillin-binding protein 4)
MWLRSCKSPQEANGMVKNAMLLLLASILVALLLRELRQVSLRSADLPASTLEVNPVLQQLQSAAKKPGLEAAAIGFCLLDEHGQVMLEHAARTAFIPASSLKTLTTATALERWGPEHRIETQLISTTPVVAGQIAGDVILHGGGDPMLSLTDLQSWAQTLKQQGIRHIGGRIISDGGHFRGSIYADFWGWGDIGNGYGSPVCGLNLEHNRYTVSLLPGRELGARTQLLGTVPEVPGVRWINETITHTPDSGDGVVIHTGEQSGVIFLRGTVPMGTAPFQVLGAVPNPPFFAAHHFRQILIANGITVAGQADVAERDLACPESSVIFTHRSPPLKQIVTSIHATSDNHETECLYRLLGAEKDEPSEQTIRQHWQARGLSFQGLRLEDGCGLARADFITPHDLARLQHLALNGPQGQVYLKSLLSREGLRWKGGAMSGVRSITGQITTRGGRKLCFALIINHFTDSHAAQALRDEILQRMADV